MVVIDGLHNGWRYLALPVAQTDELVMDAVLAVSATHSYLKPDQYVQGYPDTHGLYTRAIAGLQNRSLNQSTQESILLTILILLIGVMVTGNSDFPILIQMLQSAFDVVGREDGLGNGELAGFIVRQVHK